MGSDSFADILQFGQNTAATSCSIVGPHCSEPSAEMEELSLLAWPDRNACFCSAKEWSDSKVRVLSHSQAVLANSIVSFKSKCAILLCMIKVNLNIEARSRNFHFHISFLDIFVSKHSLLFMGMWFSKQTFRFTLQTALLQAKQWF